MATLADEYGGYWGEGHPVYTLADWRHEVASNDTRLGYWAWVASKIEEEGYGSSYSAEIRRT